MLGLLEGALLNSLLTFHFLLHIRKEETNNPIEALLVLPHGFLVMGAALFRGLGLDVERHFQKDF